MKPKGNKTPSNSDYPVEIQLKQAISMPEIVNVLIQVCEHLNQKTELHIHFVINSHNSNSHNTESTITGSNSINMNHCHDSITGIGNDNNMSRTGHTAYGYNSSTTGNIQVNYVTENTGTVGLQTKP